MLRRSVICPAKFAVIAKYVSERVSTIVVVTTLDMLSRTKTRTNAIYTLKTNSCPIFLQLATIPNSQQMTHAPHILQYHKPQWVCHSCSNYNVRLSKKKGSRTVRHEQMTNWRNLELDNMPSTPFGNQNKINFYVFITCDNSLATAQLTGWKPAAATRCYSASIGLHLLGARNGPGLQY